MTLKQKDKDSRRLNILNQAYEDTIKRFGFFAATFLFWLPKYEDFYNSRISKYKQKGNLKQ